MHNMRARWYGSTFKRFASIDPYDDKENKDYLNRYLYTSGNPLRYIDSWGLAKFDITPNTEANQTKMRCAIKTLRSICSKVGNGSEPFTTKYIIRLLPDRPNTNIPPMIYNFPYTRGFYTHRTKTITINSFYWEQPGTDYISLAYVLMEELIHKIQARNFAGWNYHTVSGIRNLYDILFNMKFRPNDADDWASQQILEYESGSNVGFVRASKALFEVWANSAVRYGLKHKWNEPTFLDITNTYLAGYHPALFGNDEDFDPYLFFYQGKNAKKDLKGLRLPSILQKQPDLNTIYFKYC